MKKGKSITFQLADPYEKSLYEYCQQLHNFSGTLKRMIGNSEGFKKFLESQKNKPVVITPQNGAGIKIKIGG